MTSIDLDIRREDGAAKGRWVAEVDGHEAELTYSHAGPKILILDHAGVPDAIGGRGVGRALIARAVADARKDGVQLAPLCPFARALFEKTPEWADVWRR